MIGDHCNDTKYRCSLLATRSRAEEDKRKGSLRPRSAFYGTNMAYSCTRQTGQGNMKYLVGEKYPLMRINTLTIRDEKHAKMVFTYDLLKAGLHLILVFVIQGSDPVKLFGD